MKFKEKLQIESPERVGYKYVGGCSGCPSDYGYEARPKIECKWKSIANGDACAECWEREAPDSNGNCNSCTKGYDEGMTDAWQLVKKLYSEMNIAEMMRAIDCEDLGEVLEKYTPQEAIAKLKAYEEAQEIKVGDIFIDTNTGCPCVLSNIVEEDEERPYIVTYSDGSGGSRSKKVFLEDYKKTGKHIDIQQILEQIGE